MTGPLSDTTAGLPPGVQLVLSVPERAVLAAVLAEAVKDASPTVGSVLRQYVDLIKRGGMTGDLLRPLSRAELSELATALRSRPLREPQIQRACSMVAELTGERPSAMRIGGALDLLACTAQLRRSQLVLFGRWGI